MPILNKNTVVTQYSQIFYINSIFYDAKKNMTVFNIYFHESENNDTKYGSTTGCEV